MSEKKKPKAPQFVTPTGIASYPWLNKPDPGNERVKRDTPEYHVTLRFKNDDPEFLKLIEKLTPVHADACAQMRSEKPAKAKKMVVKDIAEEELDKESGEPTGYSKMRFKMKSEITDKKTKEKRSLSPAIVDGLRNEVKGVAIYGGSLLRVAFAAAPFHVEASNMIGLTYYMNAVQVVKLAKSQNNAANAFDVLDSDGLGDAETFGDAGDGEEGESTGAAAEAGTDF